MNSMKYMKKLMKGVKMKNKDKLTEIKINDEIYEIEEELEEEEINLNAEDIIKIEYIQEDSKIEANKKIKIPISRSLDRGYRLFYKIEAVDLRSLEIIELERILSDYKLALLTFKNKLKLITLNENYNLKKQLDDLINLRNKEINKNKIKEYNREIGKFLFAQETKRVYFYFIIFGKTKEELITTKNEFENSFSNSFFNYETLTTTEQIKILKKLNNL